jgi:hypothetical protein
MIWRRFSKASPYSITAVLVFAAVMTFMLIRSFAAIGPASLYTSPGGTQSVEKGKNFTIDVRIGTGGNVSVTGASIQVSYPSDKLAVQGVSFSGSPYSLEVAQSNSGGVLRIERAALPVIAGGDKLFAKVTFKALADGAAAINFTGSSFVLSGDNDSNLPLNRSGATYNISTPSKAGSPARPPGNGNTNPGSGSAGSGRQSSSTSEQGGIDGGTPEATPSNNSGSGADVGSDKTQAGVENTTDNESLSSLQVRVVDKNNKPVKGAKVTVAGQTFTTDKNGVAGFERVPLGQQKIVIDYSGKKTSYPAEVKGMSELSDPEIFTVTVEKRATNPLVWIITPLLGLMIGAGLIVLILRLKQQRQNLGRSNSTYTQPIPVTPVAPDNSSGTTRNIKAPDLPQPGAVVAPLQNDQPPAEDKNT